MAMIGTDDMEKELQPMAAWVDSPSLCGGIEESMKYSQKGQCRSCILLNPGHLPCLDRFSGYVRSISASKMKCDSR